MNFNKLVLVLFALVNFSSSCYAISLDSQNAHESKIRFSTPNSVTEGINKHRLLGFMPNQNKTGFKWNVQALFGMHMDTIETVKKEADYVTQELEQNKD